MEEWYGKHYSYFQNRECEYFPCHAGANPENFSCLFCYCPLYALGEKCGGNFTYTSSGVKDCSGCLIPHRPEGYEYVQSQFDQIVELARKKGT